MIGERFGTLVVMGVLPATYTPGDRSACRNRKYWLRCDICSQDEELWPDGSIKMSSGHLGQGKKPCGCSMAPKWKEWQAKIRVDRRANSLGYKFHGWSGEYKGNKTKIILSCKTHGKWDTTSLSDFFIDGCGCRRCNNGSYTEDEWRHRLSSGYENMGYEFIGWNEQFKGMETRLRIKCYKHGIWDHHTGRDFLYGYGCPQCSKKGFKQGRSAYVYILRSGVICKIGISNNYEKRVSSLIKKTPFDFELQAVAFFKKGIDALLMERFLHKKYICAMLSAFDGATEWFFYEDGIISDLIAKSDEIKIFKVKT